jgi:hypothetical protein
MDETAETKDKKAELFMYVIGTTLPTYRYKPEGSGFDSRWCHWNFSVT